MANPDILITPGQGTIGFSGTNTGTIQLRVAESGDIHFEGDQGSLLSLSDDLSDSLFSVNDAAGMPVFEVFADDTIKAYRNNEAKLEIDPDNNRVRLRDNVFVSGNLTVSGDITSASATHEATSYTASTHVSGLSGYFGKVGIGTTDLFPGNIFHVDGGTNGWVVFERNSKRLFLNANYAAGNAYAQVATYGVDNMSLSLSSDDTKPEQLFLKHDGGVGIGTTGPLALVDIASDDGTDHTDDTPDTLLRLRKTFLSSADKDSAVNFDVSRYIAGGNNRPRTRLDFVLAGDENDTYDNREPNVNVLSIRSDRKVGIGTTNPNNTLHVHTASAGSVTADTDRDDLVIENSANVGLTFLSPNTTKQAIAFGDPQNSRVGLITYDHAHDSLAIRANNTDNLLTVQSGGEVGVGGTGQHGALFTVHGDTSITGQLVVGGGQTAESIKLLRQSDTNPYISWYSDISTREAYIQGSPSHFYIVNQNNNNIELMTNGAVNFTVSPTATISRQNVGIGTTVPDEKLHIEGAGNTKLLLESTANHAELVIKSENNTYSPYVVFKDAGADRYYIQCNPADRLIFRPQGTSDESKWIVFDHQGHVGIGTETPTPGDMHSSMGDAKLHVYDSASGVVARFQGGSDADGQHGAILINHSNDRGLLIRGGRGVGNTASGSLGLVGETAQPLGNAGGTIHLRAQSSSINGDVFVGIGTASPNSALEVFGQVRILDVAATPSYGARLVVGRDTAQDLEFIVDDLDCKIVADQDSDSDGNHNFILDRAFAGNGANNFQIQKDGTSQLLIDTDGKVGIGTTIPTKDLHVQYNVNNSSDIGGDGLLGGNAGNGLLIQNIATNGNSYANLDFRANNADGRIAFTYDDSNHGSFHFVNDVRGAVKEVMKIRGALQGTKRHSQVGIGTTNPTGALNVYQSGDFQPAFLVEGSQGSLFSVEDTLTGSLMSVNDIAGLPVFEAFDDGTIVMGQYNSGDLVVTGNKVGIGTTSPETELHVFNGTAKFEGVDGNDFSLELGRSDNANTWKFNHAGADLRIYNSAGAGSDILLGLDAGGGVIANNVGIGVATPSFKLQVNGDVRINSGDSFLDDGQSIRWGGTAAKIDGSSGGDYLRFYTDGAERMRIKTGGNVGIGTTNPSSKLQIFGNTAGTAKLQIEGESGADPYINFLVNNTTHWAVGADDNRGDCFKISQHSALGTNDFFTVRTDGKVGIGTDNPGSLLDVDKDQQAATYVNVINSTNHANSQAGVRIDSNTSNNFLLAHADSRTLTRYGVAIGGYAELLSSAGNGLLIGTSALNKPIIFGTQSAERMRIGGDGNVGIGTTGPLANLQIDTPAATSAGQGLRINRPSAGTHYHAVEFSTNGTVDWSVGQNSNDSFEVYENGLASTTRLSIKEGGNVGIGTTSPEYLLDIGGDTASTSHTIRMRQNNGGTAIRIGAGGGGNDVTLLRIDGESTNNFGESDAGQYGFSIKYMGSRGADANSLSIFSDNQNAGSQVEAFTMFQGGSIGIGTSTPQGVKLHVNGSTIVSGTLYVKNDQIWEDADSTDIIAKLHDNNDDGIFDIYQNNSVVNRIHGNGASYFKGGNVGIGTDVPATNLDVFGGAGTKPNDPFGGQNQLFISNGSTNNAGITIAADDGVNDIVTFIQSNQSSDTAYVGTQSSHKLVLRTNNNDRLTIDSSNTRVGIGTTSPSETLEINHSNHEPVLIKSVGNYNSMITMDSNRSSANSYVGGLDGKWNGTQVASIYLRTGGDTINKDDGYITLLTASAGALVERMRIQSDGKVGIGTDAPATSLEVLAADPVLTVRDTEATVANASATLRLAESSATNTLNGHFDLKFAGSASGGDLDISRYNNTSLVAQGVRIRHDGNVGIGTTNPGSALHIYKTAPIISLTDSNSFSDANDRFIFRAGTPDGGFFQWYDNSASTTTNLMFIGADGNVGIGTTIPVAALHIHGNSDNGDDDCQLIISDADTTAGSKVPSILFRSLNDAGSAYVGTNRIRGTKGYGMQFATETSSEGVLGTVMTLDNSQNVGIGTTSPDGKLHIHTASAGSVTADSSVDDLVVENNNHGGISLLVPNDKASAITFGTPSDSIGAKIQWDNTTDAFVITTANNGAFIRFNTDNQTEAMRIDSSQNVGIGTTVPSGRLHVENNSTGIIVANDQITGNAFEVFGAQGNLLTVTDDLSDSLFSVNDAAGMPVFEVFADDTIKSYRNNESKLEVDPDNNRIRLRDHAFISGNLHISGSENGGGMEIGEWPGAADFGYVGNVDLNHADGNNYALLQHTAGSTYLNSTATLYLRLDNSSTWEMRCTSSIATVNYGNKNVDFAVNGDTTSNLIYVDAGTEVVGIGAAPNRADVCLELNPTATTDAFIAFDGTSASDESKSLQGTTSSAGHNLQGYIRVLINNSTRWIPFYD